MKSFCLRGCGRILWREATEQTTFCIGIFALLVLMQSSLTTMASFDMIQSPSIAFGFSMALFMTAIYAAASSALAFTAEVDAGTFVFQRTKPISWSTYLSGKLSWTVLSSIVLGLTAWIETSLWQGGLPGAHDTFLAFGISGVGIIEGIAWGLIATIAVRAPLRAVITGIAIGSLVAWVTVVIHHGITDGGSVSVITAYYEAAWTRLIVAAAVLATGIFLARVWYRTGQPVGRGLLSRLLRSESDAVALPGQWSSLGQPCRGRGIRLLWQAWRQVRSPALVYWGCCLIALTWAGLYYLSRRDHTSDSTELAFNCIGLAEIAILSFSALLAGYTFGADQKARFLQLARDGVSPWEIWLSRLAVMAVVLLPPAVVVLLPLRYEMGQAFEFPLLQPLSILLVVLGYCSALAIGQACSMFVRSRIVALLAAPVVFGCFAFWLGLAVFWAGLGWKLGAAPLLGALLIGTRLLAGTRLRQDNSWRAIRAPVLLVVLAAVFSYQAFAYHRVHQIQPYDSGCDNDESLDPLALDGTWRHTKYMREQLGPQKPPHYLMEFYLMHYQLKSQEYLTYSKSFQHVNRHDYAQPWRTNSRAVYGSSNAHGVTTYSDMLKTEAELNQTLREVIAQLDTPNETLRDCIEFLEHWPDERSRHAVWLAMAYHRDQLWLQHGAVDEQYATYGFHDKPLPLQYRWFSFERKRMLRILDRAYRIAAERADEYEQAVINDQIGGQTIVYGFVTELDIIPYKPDRPIWYQMATETLFDSALEENGFHLLDSTVWLGWYSDNPFYNAEAQRRGTILYLALRMHYNDHSTLPESLDSLVDGGYLDRLPVIPIALEPFYYAPGGAEDEQLAAMIELANDPENQRGTGLPAPDLLERDYASPFLWYPTRLDEDMDPCFSSGSFIRLDFGS